MPWNDTTKIMTGPLNINANGDIQRASGVNSGDLGICFINGDWNKWAKWKPERNQSIRPISLEDRKENNFGLVITKFTTLETLIADYINQWAYVRPQVGDRFHHNDLINPANVAATGYCGKAGCFFRRAQSTFPTTYYTGSGGLTFIAQWEPETQFEKSAPASIRRSELRIGPPDPNSATLADTYFGVLIYSPYWQNPMIKTSTTAVGSETYTSSVSFTDTELQNFPSSVSVYPVFSPTAIGSVSSVFPAAGLFALPMSPFDLQVRSVDSYVALDARVEAKYKRGRVYLSGAITMNTNRPGTVVTGVSYNVYTATSMQDKTGAQIGATQSYSTPLTEDNELTVDYPIQVERPDYLRIVVTGFVGDTELTSDFNIGVTDGTGDDDILV